MIYSAISSKVSREDRSPTNSPHFVFVTPEMFTPSSVFSSVAAFILI